MYDGLYTLQNYAQRNTAENLSISIWEVPPGEQGIANFHEHDTIEVAMITAGTGVHVLNAQRAAIQAGDVLLVYPGLRHGYEDCETLGLVNLMYDPAKLPFPILDGGQIPLFRRFFPLHVEPASIPRSPDPILRFPTRAALETVLAEIRQLDRELNGSRPGNMMVSLVKLLDLLLATLRLAAPQVEDLQEKPHFPLEKILEYVNRNFTHDIPLDKLIRMSCYSKRVFQYKFKNLTGYGATEYILRKRVALARDLLRQRPDLPIGEVGFQCGFLDSNYFSRKFREIAGATPTAYRKANA